MSKHSENQPQRNEFRRFWDLGFRDLLPVIPPRASVRNAGKRPGLKGSKGWYGCAADSFMATPETIDAWHDMGASVGLSCNGSGVFGLDIDVLTPEWAERVRAIAFEMLGPTTIRVGQAPKMMLLYRCARDTTYRRLLFNDGRKAEDGVTVLRPAIVELLAGPGKWFVVAGDHPVTGKPYFWPKGVPSFDMLPRPTAVSVQRFFDRLVEELPRAAKLGGAGSVDRALIDQSTLIGDERVIAEAMQALPNDPAMLGYDEWCEVAIALRGALPGNYGLGLELFEAWTDKAGLAAPTEDAERVYGSVNPPFALGADYILDHAQAAGWQGARPLPEGWFDPAPEIGDAAEPYVSIFGSEAATAIVADAWTYQDPATIPPRDFLYGTHIVRRFASMTVAPSKVGKSSLATVDILAMVTGRTLLPRMKPKGALRVWYLNGEDPLEELQRRVAAAMLKYGITAEDVGDRLFLNSGRSLRLVTAIETKGGVQLLRPVIDGLIAELRRLAIDVLIIDPFVSSHQISENDNSGIDMVMSEWIMTADAANCGIEFIHHARKGSPGSEPDGSVDSSRGATSLVAKMRSVRALANMTKAQGKQLGLTTAYRYLFRVTDAASNLAPWVDDETEWYRRENVDLGNGLDGDETGRWVDGDHIAVVVAWTAGEVEGGTENTAAILEALGRETWREDVQARGEWVGNAVAAALRLDLSEPDDKATVKRLISKLIKDGVLERVKMRDKKRNMRWYVKAKSSVYD